MPERLVIIGADEPGLNAARTYLAAHPGTEVIVLYPELNPLPEFVCSAIEKYLQADFQIPETLRVFAVDKEAKRVLTRDTISAVETAIKYDRLIFAAGAAPDCLNIPGEHLRGIVRVATFEDAERLRGIEGKTVVIGNGTNLLMTVSALMRRSKGTIEAVIPAKSKGMQPLSDNLMGMVRHHLVETGIAIHAEQHLQKIVRNGESLEIVMHEQTIVADRIVIATPSRPVTELASEAGLSVDRADAVVVDSRLQTTDPNIYACGSCAAFIVPGCENPIPGLAVRASERRQAAVLADVLSGGDQEFSTPSSAFSLVFGDLVIAGAGLTVENAKLCGFKPMSATVVQFDRAHFMPEVELMTLELVFDAPTRRVVGIQGLGKSGDGLRGRISAVSAILSSKPTIEDVSNLEVAYSPPFASAMDVLNTVANVADNMLSGTNEGVSAAEFERLWAEREANNLFFLDCRELGNARPFLERHPLHWNHIPQGEVARRIEEVPVDRKIVLICNTGARSYEAQVLLKHAGRENVVNVDGGMSAVKQSGIEV